MSKRFEMKPLVRKQNPAFSTSNLKAIKRRRKQKILVILFQLLFLLIIFTLVYFLLFVYRYKSISIEGLNSLQKSEIENIVEEYIPSVGFSSILSNPLFVRSGAISKAILDYSYLIKDVKVNHDYFGFSAPVLGIQVTERMPFASWCTFDSINQVNPNICSVIDSDGFAYKQEASSSFEEKTIEYRSNQALLGDFFGGSTINFKKIEEVKDQINAIIIPSIIGTISELAPNQYSFVTNKGISINVDIQNSLQTEIERLREVWARDDVKRSSYIDMRFGNKVFYKPDTIGASASSSKINSTSSKSSTSSPAKSSTSSTSSKSIN